MGRFLGAIGAMELLVAIAVFIWFANSRLFYPAIALAVLAFGTMLLASEFMDSARVATP